MPTVASPISTPAGFAPAFAVGFSDANDCLETVSAARPLPVLIQPANAPAPLSGQCITNEIVGPFMAAPNVPIIIALDGDWTGSAQLRRSIDGGTTKLALLVGGQPWGEFATSGCEQAWVESEAGVSFYLDITLSSGTLNYRVSQ